MGVFVVKGFLEVGGGSFIVFVVFAQGFVIGDGGVEGFPGGEGGFDFGTLFGGFGITEGEGTAVEVVSPLAGLSSL